MKVGVWGLGAVGTGIACRLATAPFVSQLLLMNRTFETAISRAADIAHGLAFAPSCWHVRAIDGRHVASTLRDLDVDLLILAQGEGVPPGGTRAALYAKNRDMFRETVLPHVRGFRGIVLVVSNPVDLMARLVLTEGDLPSERVLGLGTVVETARFRAALAANAIPSRASHDVWAWIVGSHDNGCVAVPYENVALGLPADAVAMEDARGEVVNAAERVKAGARVSTLHPIVEGVFAVTAAIAADARRTLTVSVLDTGDKDQLFYSVPCEIGRDGIVARHPKALATLDGPLAACREKLRQTLYDAAYVEFSLSG